MGSSWFEPDPNPMRRKFVPLPEQKQYVFFFHLNKPATKEALKNKNGKPVWTLHYKRQCLLVNSIKCSAQVETKSRKRQPWLVVCGKSSMIKVYEHPDGTREAWIYS